MRLIQAGILFLAGGTGAALAGVIVHISDKGDGNGPLRHQQILYAQDGLLRVHKLDDKVQVLDSTLIRDGVNWQVDTQKRTYP